MKPQPNTLEEAINKTINRDTVNNISDITGISTNLLYRYCYSESSPSHAVMPLKNVIPITKATGDFTLLDYLETEFNRIAFNLPGDISFVNPDKVIQELQINIYRATIAFHDCQKNNSFENYAKARNELTNLAKYILSMAKTLDRQFVDQPSTSF